MTVAAYRYDLPSKDDAAADRVAGRAVGLHDRVADWLAGDRSKPAVGADEHDLDVARRELGPDVVDRAPQVPGSDAQTDLWQDAVGDVGEAAGGGVAVEAAKDNEQGAADDDE